MQGCQHRLMAASSIPPRAHRFAPFGTKELPAMNRLQRSFFTRHYRPQFEAGIAMDVDGQYGYPIVMLHELLSLWDADPHASMAGLRLIAEAYPGSSVRYQALEGLADMHYLREEWAEAFAVTKGSRSLVAFVGLADLLQPRVRASQIVDWGKPSVTKAGWQNFESVAIDLQAELDAFHDEHNVSLVAHFWARLHADEPLDTLAASLVEFIGPDIGQERVAELIAYGRSFPPFPMTAFIGFEGLERPIPAPWRWENPYAFECLFRAFLRRLFRASENRAREGAGLPRVGEGLVSEVRLLHQLRAAFPLEVLDHQVRPGWLAPQSLDIAIRGRNIAIEYQGVQHSRPVELFGGPPAFEKQQERDAMKRWLCVEHGMTLIEVHPDYRLEGVIQAIREALAVSAGEGHPAGGV